MLLPILAYAIYHTDSGVSAVYDIIASYDGGFGGRYPKSKDERSTYFGMTRDQMEYAIDVLRDTFESGWYTNDFDERIKILENIAINVAAQTGNIKERVRMWLGEIYLTATKDLDVLKYLSGGDLSRIDVIKRKTGETIDNIGSSIKENVEFFVSYEPPIFGTIARVVPLIAGAVAVYFGYKLFKTN